jgi:hypothetical protein
MYRILPVLVFLAASGCGDGKPGIEHAGPSSSQYSNSTDIGADPVAVVRRYYEAIRNRQYDSAYALWEGSGEASGQTRAEFASGFSKTEQTIASMGDSVHIEAAAGSQYASVPVIIDATLRGGTRQHFTGTYILRRAMVDGATPEQRSWHIYSAHLQQD